MHDLRLVGVHEDGDHLLLVGGDGQRYRVLIDDALRAAVRRDRARLGQLQIAMEGVLRPRDIQARIRSGESAADIAAASGLPVEHVRRYEGAVLAEREHVARRARALPVRRRQGTAPTLDELVLERLSARDAAADQAWDAWRREDGSWTVRLGFRAGSKDRSAHWRFDVATSALEPLDDEARWLGADTDGDSGPVGGRRLNAVRERVYDVEADGGVREQPGSARNRPSEQEPHPPAGDELPPEQPAERERRRTVDLLETLRGRRGRRQPMPALDGPGDELPEDAGPLLGVAGEPADGPDEGHPYADVPVVDTPFADELLIEQVLGAGPPGPADLLDEVELDAAMRLSEQAPAAHPPASRPDEATDAHVLALPLAASRAPVDDPVAAGTDEDADLPAAGSSDGPAGDGDEGPGTPEPASAPDPAAPDPAAPDVDVTAADVPVTAGRARAKPKRAAVPSWDDIVFGARRDS